jgi:hypothetical protein
MLPTYRATLRGDRIEWDGDVPELGDDQQAVVVYVTIVGHESESDEGQGRRMAEALERVAADGGVSSISDPVRWQREQREDRDIVSRS